MKKVGATVCRDIQLIDSDLDPEGTWMEASYVWVFVVNLGGLRGGSFVFTKTSLMNFRMTP